MNDPDHDKRMRETRQLWDEAAHHFDEAPDHGLLAPAVRKAWVDLLSSFLPTQRGDILDIGCGTGSLSIILADLGHAVTAIDASANMITIAKAKAEKTGHPIQFEMMDAAYPQFSAGRFDGIVCRHLLWALPKPAEVLKRWADLLKPSGFLLLIEGFWHTGAGLHASEVIKELPPALVITRIDNLSSQPALWGSVVHDERYALLARQESA